jgi:dinuclear metal center YbgI/SA1388 family protein
MKLTRIVDTLNRELAISEFEDASNNGLQVENSGQVRKVCCGVDASMEFFEAARAKGADLLVTHHGLSWGDSLKYITELNYRRLAFLVRYDMALYAAHLPLDAHPRLGNNILIARALKLQRVRRFGLYHGKRIGFQGRLQKPMRYERFKKVVAEVTGGELRTMDYGRKTINTVAVISGGAPREVMQAAQANLDVYVSGEPNLEAYTLAREYGINAVFAGHYASEVFGVRALADYLHKKLSLDAEFVDFKIPW